MTPKIEQAMHHIVLLHALKDAPPELHKAVLGDKTSEEEMHKHLMDYATALHRQMQQSAQSGVSPTDAKDGKLSRGQKVGRFLDAADGDEKANASAQPDKASDRAARVGKLFGK